MAYTTIDKGETYFNTNLFTGNGSTQSITGVGFQPDWVWIKDLQNSTNHMVFDSVRGTGKELHTQNGDAETTQADTLTAFGTDGFSLGSNNDVNKNSTSFVSWNWLAGTSVSGTTTGSGTGKAYSGTVNTTAGFSIITYLGNGTAGHTIPHHLGVAPQVVLVKRRGEGGQWVFGHSKIGFTKFLELDLTGAAQTSSLRFNDTAPTSTVFTVGTTYDTNKNDITIVAYCFAEKKGYSKFGKYTGNGNANGPFIYTGFKPAWVLQKNISETQGWQLQDNDRDGYNGDNDLLQPHDGAAESGVNRIDILSNGFKVITTDNGQNKNSNEYIYMAFAEHPFVSSSGTPTTAR